MENNEVNKPKKTGWRGPVGSNPGGRPLGTKNKNTAAIRTAYQNLVEMNLENMSTWIGQVAQEDPSKAMDLMIKLSEYVIPKLARTEVTGKDGEDLFKDLTFSFGPSVDERLDVLDIEEIDE